MLLGKVFDFIRENPVLMNLLTFGVGLWAGHVLAIGRDRRVEWNDLTEAAYQDLRRLLGSRGEDVTLVASYLPFYRRRGFRKALARYEKASDEAQGEYDPALGQSKPVAPEKTDQLRVAAIRLLRYYRRR